MPEANPMESHLWQSMDHCNDHWSSKMGLLGFASGIL